MAVRDIVQAAAGVGGADNLYIEDVFSTFTYTGDSLTQTIENGIALGDTNYGPAVEFNGTSDYLSRASSLDGAVNSKTFTLSMWLYRETTTGNTFPLFIHNFSVWSYLDNKLRVRGVNSSGAAVFDSITATNVLPVEKWVHILMSVDLTNASNRYLYINDSALTPTYTTYTNDLISLTGNYDYVGGPSSPFFKGKMSNVYFDTTYRNLSVEANRRLFITSDGQPATGQASLSPILYLPFDDTNSPGTNLGTGGNYTVNGNPTAVSIGGPYIGDGFGQGGLVWIKGRSTAGYDHRLFDTDRGVQKYLVSNTTASQTTDLDTLTGFNANGFTIGADQYVNNGTITYASWTFRKAPKFFDCVTYTGTGSARTVSHNLGSVPGCIIVKRTDTTGDWQVYHRANTANPETDYLVLNSTAATVNSSTRWNDTLPTDSVFTVGTDATVNASGGTYVAYLFAHNDGGFGDDGEQNVISCGSYTGTGVDNNTITLGYEPQWILIRKTNTLGGWMMVDSTRGIATDGVDPYLQANETDAEFSGTDLVDLTATGFSLQGAGNYWNASGSTYIYIAIRRGPMKTPTAGTEVFTPITKTADAPTAEYSEIGFFFDAVFNSAVAGTYGGSSAYSNRLSSSLTRIGTSTSQALVTSATSAEASYSYTRWDGQTFSVATGWVATKFAWYFFRRAPGFFDVVCYTGTEVNTAINHNLEVIPEMMIVKARSRVQVWMVYHKGIYPSDPATYSIVLSSNGAGFLSSTAWNDTEPTSTTFTLGASSLTNSQTDTYVAYLFASLAGVSKVGSYTGTGTTLQVDCGFSTGARFVLIKRTDSTGDWYVWDSARGIVAGNDPYLLLNSTAAEVTSTDYVDTYSAGFEITSTAPAAINASGGTFIFLAIA